MSEPASPHFRRMISWAYDLSQRMYSEVPYRCSSEGRAFPAWHYYLEVTRRCNLRCRMCQYISWLRETPGREQRQGELTFDEWRGVIEQIGRFSFLTFTGGEPLAREDFADILECGSKKTRTHVITNMTLMDEERAARFITLAAPGIGGTGLNFMGVSLEGPEERHDEIRGQAGAFSKSIAGIELIHKQRNLAQKRCPLVHITTVIQKSNLDTLHLLPRIAAEAGADVWNLATETRMFEIPDLGERAPGAYSADEIPWPRIPADVLGPALDRAVAAARDVGIELRLPRMPREELLAYYDRQLDLSRYACRSPWNTVLIGRTGDVYPCWLKKIGNVREHALRQMWNNDAARAFRRSCRKRLFAPCPGCCFLEYAGRK